MKGVNVEVINLPHGYNIKQVFIHNAEDSLKLDIHPLAHVVLEEDLKQLSVSPKITNEQMISS